MGLPNEMVTHKKGAKNKNRPVKKSKPASANGHVRNHTIEENGNHLDIPEPQNFKVKCIFSLIETNLQPHTKRKGQIGFFVLIWPEIFSEIFRGLPVYCHFFILKIEDSFEIDNVR